MSLDVYLEDESRSYPCICPECGHEHTAVTSPELFSANITHNLARMAEAAGVYEYLWRPDEVGVQRARELILPLQAGLDRLRAEPERFHRFQADNGWGRYDDFVPWLEEYIAACHQHPEAVVRVSR